MPPHLKELREKIFEMNIADGSAINPMTTAASSCFKSSRAGDDFCPTTPSRTKSAMGRLQTIRESRICAASPIVSPFLSTATDVFGESLQSLDAWAEEDSFQHIVSPRRRKMKSTSPSHKTGRRSSRLSKLKENTNAIDLDF